MILPLFPGCHMLYVTLKQSLVKNRLTYNIYFIFKVCWCHNTELYACQDFPFFSMLKNHPQTFLLVLHISNRTIHSAIDPLFAQQEQICGKYCYHLPLAIAALLLQFWGRGELLLKAKGISRTTGHPVWGAAARWENEPKLYAHLNPENLTFKNTKNQDSCYSIPHNLLCTLRGAKSFIPHN